MNSLKEIKDFDVLPGSNINDTAIEALKIAKKENCIVRFKFNAAKMIVNDYDSMSSILNSFYKQESNI